MPARARVHKGSRVASHGYLVPTTHGPAAAGRHPKGSRPVEFKLIALRAAPYPRGLGGGPLHPSQRAARGAHWPNGLGPTGVGAIQWTGPRGARDAARARACPQARPGSAVPLPTGDAAAGRAWFPEMVERDRAARTRQNSTG